MEEYLNKFKVICNACISSMIADDNVKHDSFVRSTRSMRLLYERYAVKINIFNTKSSFQRHLDMYSARLEIIRSGAITIK